MQAKGLNHRSASRSDIDAPKSCCPERAIQRALLAFKCRKRGRTDGWCALAGREELFDAGSEGAALVYDGPGLRPKYTGRRHGSTFLDSERDVGIHGAVNSLSNV